MTEDERKAYAKFVIKDHATDVEFISIHEMYELWTQDEDLELSHDDATAVYELIRKAKVEVSW